MRATLLWTALASLLLQGAWVGTVFGGVGPETAEGRAIFWDDDLGTQEIVLPGFEPVRTEGTRVRLFARDYVWRDSYLPEQVTSRGSAIAGAVGLVANVDGVDAAWTASSVEVIESTPHHATIRAAGTPIPGLSVRVTTRVEYDGVAMVRLQIVPRQPVEISSLRFVARIDDSPSMEVLAFDAPGIRRQERRDDLLDLPYRGRFMNVLGFADGQRSFWWFADNAEGWIWNPEDVTRIDREGGHIVLVQRLIGKATVLTRPVEMAFNFLATPVRDLGTEWRRQRVVHGEMNERQASLGGKYRLWWSSAFAHDTLPYTELPPETAGRVSPHDRLAYPGLARNRALVEHAQRTLGIFVLPYFSAHALSELDPALQRFGDQWRVQPPMVWRDHVGPYRDAIPKPMMTHRARSYSSYLVARMAAVSDDLGTHGVYFDHAFLTDTHSPRNGAWQDADGGTHGSLGILGVREFLKRLRVMYHQRGREGYVFVHISNREIIPAYTFATGLVDGEQYQARTGLKEGDYIGLLSLEELRTRFAPGQYGVLNYWLSEAWKGRDPGSDWWGSARQVAAYRNQMALALLHDIPVWPVGAPETERTHLIRQLDDFGIARSHFIGYWEERSGASSPSEVVVASVYSRPEERKALVVIVNLSAEPIVADVVFDRAALGIADRPGEIEVTGEAVLGAGADGTYRMRLAPKDFALVTVAAK